MPQQFLTLDDINLANKRVLIREDFNVPIENSKVQSDLRIRAALPGIKQALAAKAQVRLMSHLGRPQAGKWDEKYSLKPVATCLEQLLGRPVRFVQAGIDADLSATDNLVLYENVRFLVGETENDATLARKMANLCDVFVMDAFGSAHRAHASTVGVVQFAPVAVAGPLIVQEVTALDKIMRNAVDPVVAIIGGSKVSTKIDVLFSLLDLADVLIIGGGMANTLLAAQGIDVGPSLYEPDLISLALKVIDTAEQKNCRLLLPIDFVKDNGKILDIGPASIDKYVQEIRQAKTIIWNGPLGVFEDPRFANGTKQIATAIANSSAFSVAGGGETLTALDEYGLAAKISYVSTGGGAFLEYIEGKKLPAIAALTEKSKN